MNQDIDMDRLAEKKWQFTYDRKMSYQRIHMFHFGYCLRFSKFFNVKIDSEIFRIKDQNVAVYFEFEDHHKAFNKIKTDLLSQKSVPLVKKMISIIKADYKDFISFSKKRPESYKKCSNRDLVKEFKKFYRQNEKVSLANWFLYLYIEEILTEVLKAALERELKDERLAGEILNALSHPTKMLPIDLYNSDLYNVALVPKSTQSKALGRFTRKYKSWGVYDVLFDIPSVSLHESKIKNISKGEASKKIAEITGKYEKQKRAILALKKYWSKNKALSPLIELYTLNANFKDWKNYYRELNSYKMRIILKEIASRFDATLEEVSFLTEEETILALTNKSFDFENIRQRMKNGSIVFIDGKESIVSDEKMLNLIDSEVSIKDEVQEIKGAPAFKGIVRGIVRIVSSPNDMSKINSGDILVTSTTRPDYLPFMQKSAGFVTNEGGMLSHAAIMARELKKPCIIGTKVATKVLKDGDFIELDADNGIVKILKNK